MTQHNHNAEFDQFADNYEQVHQKTISLSGEESKYFTELKIKILSSYLKKNQIQITSFLDYGCGTGRALYPIKEEFSRLQYYGVDPSSESIDVANNEANKSNCTHLKPIYATLTSDTQLPKIDCCMCAVVAHHIPPDNHRETFSKIYDALNPGGHLFLFEHNPHNPLTRKVVRDCPFDKDAVLLKPSYAKKMLSQCGFKIESLQYYFFYPKALSFMRPTEKLLQKIPLGAQYVIIAKKTLS